MTTRKQSVSLVTVILDTTSVTVTIMLTRICSLHPRTPILCSKTVVNSGILVHYIYFLISGLNHRFRVLVRTVSSTIYIVNKNVNEKYHNFYLKLFSLHLCKAPLIAPCIA